MLSKNESEKSKNNPRRQLWHNYSWVLSLNSEKIPKKNPFAGIVEKVF